MQKKKLFTKGDGVNKKLNDRITSLLAFADPDLKQKVIDLLLKSVPLSLIPGIRATLKTKESKVFRHRDGFYQEVKDDNTSLTIKPRYTCEKSDDLFDYKEVGKEEVLFTCGFASTFVHYFGKASNSEGGGTFWALQNPTSRKLCILELTSSNKVNLSSRPDILFCSFGTDLISIVVDDFYLQRYSLVNGRVMVVSSVKLQVNSKYLVGKTYSPIYLNPTTILIGTYSKFFVVDVATGAQMTCICPVNPGELVRVSDNSFLVTKPFKKGTSFMIYKKRGSAWKRIQTLESNETEIVSFEFLPVTREEIKAASEVLNHIQVPYDLLGLVVEFLVEK